MSDLPLVGDMQASAPPVEIALSRAGLSGVQKAIRSARTSTRSPSPKTASSIDSSKSSGKRDMWTPF